MHKIWLVWMLGVYCPRKHSENSQGCPHMANCTYWDITENKKVEREYRKTYYFRQQNPKEELKKGACVYKTGPSNKRNHLLSTSCRDPSSLWALRYMGWIMSETHEATRSGASDSTDTKAVCTLSTQLSKRSRNDLIWDIPKTLGCTQETYTVPSTWSIIPSIKWTYIVIISQI